MLNFKNTNIFFLLLLVACLTLQAIWGLPLYIYFILIVAYITLLFWGCINISAGFFTPVFCKANTTAKEIAISFDDGPSLNYTNDILQVLKSQNVKAAFFCIGKNVETNPSLFQQIHHDGHIIGNHSYSHHFWFALFSAKKIQADLAQMDMAMFNSIGLKPTLFRPPYGVTNPNIKKAICSGGYTPVGWSVRSLDTVAREEKKLLDKVIKGIKPGAVFLFHDTCKLTLQILPQFLKEVKNRGYNIVPLDKLLALQPYA